MSVLVAVLVTFGVLTKHNEVTAFSLGSEPLYRLTAPVLLASAILSADCSSSITITCRRPTAGKMPAR